MAYVRSSLKEEYAKRRAHEVRGHWRCSPTQINERWLPFIDVNGQNLFRIWIENHMRGDASLGFVQHNYVVTAARN